MLTRLKRRVSFSETYKHSTHESLDLKSLLASGGLLSESPIMLRAYVFLFTYLFCTQISYSQLIVTESAEFSDNSATREAWLEGMLIGDSVFKENFETGYTEG